jgi:hypothetical protein
MGVKKAGGKTMGPNQNKSLKGNRKKIQKMSKPTAPTERGHDPPLWAAVAFSTD